MARRYMTRPTHIRAQDPDDQGHTVNTVKQLVYRAHALNKIEVLVRVLQAEGRGLTIVFSRTKRTAANVAEQLTDRGFAAAADGAAGRRADHRRPAQQLAVELSRAHWQIPCA